MSYKTQESHRSLCQPYQHVSISDPGCQSAKRARKSVEYGRKFWIFSCSKCSSKLVYIFNFVFWHFNHHNFLKWMNDTSNSFIDIRLQNMNSQMRWVKFPEKSGKWKSRITAREISASKVENFASIIAIARRLYYRNKKEKWQNRYFLKLVLFRSSTKPV